MCYQIALEFLLVLGELGAPSESSQRLSWPSPLELVGAETPRRRAPICESKRTEAHWGTMRASGFHVVSRKQFLLQKKPAFVVLIAGGVRGCFFFFFGGGNKMSLTFQTRGPGGAEEGLRAVHISQSNQNRLNHEIKFIQT